MPAADQASSEPEKSLFPVVDSEELKPEPLAIDAPGLLAVDVDAPETFPVDVSKPEPLALDDALSLLLSFKPAPVLALLQDKDFLTLRASAFSGFRMNHQGLGNPIVRRRLAEEAARNGAFAQKLRDLGAVETSHRPAAPAANADPTVTTQDESRRWEEDLREERRRRKADREEAREQIAALKEKVREAQRLAHEAQSALRIAESERDTQTQAADKLGQRVARLERQTARQAAERTQLLKSLSGQTPAAIRGASSRAAQAKADAIAQVGNVWEDAVCHLVDKNRHDQALAVANDVLRSDPNNLAALGVIARVMEASGDPRAASVAAGALVTASLGRGDLRSATDAMVKLLLIDPQSAEAEKVSRSFVASIRAGDRETVKYAGAAFAKLRKLNGSSYARLQSQIRKHLPAGLADTLDPAAGALGADDILPLPGFFPYPLTGAAIIAAVDRGNVALIESVRKSLTQCEATDADLHARILTALDLASEGDLTYLAPLQKQPLGAVVVDASNAAWFDQESLTAGRARLRPILELRRALRAKGYFPIQLMGDAPLPYTIDDPDELRRMIAQGEITIVDSGTDADIVLLREAKRLRAPLVTNDYMADWDPHGEVTKLRFDLPPRGNAYFWT